MFRQASLGNFVILRLIIATFLVILFYLIVTSFKNPIRVERYSFYAGNVGIGESAPSDTVPPTVSITNPINGTTVSGLVQVSAEASDSGGIANVGFYVDGNSLGTDTSAPYSVFWDTTIYPHNSVHTLIANALDNSGNQASSSAVTVTVLDITAPSVTITNPLDGSTVPKNSTVTISANATDVSGINKVEFYVNGILNCTDTTYSYSCSWKVPAKPRVLYTLQAKAYDVAGNSSTNTVSVTSK